MVRAPRTVGAGARTRLVHATPMPGQARTLLIAGSEISTAGRPTVNHASSDHAVVIITKPVGHGFNPRHWSPAFFSTLEIDFSTTFAPAADARAQLSHLSDFPSWSRAKGWANPFRLDTTHRVALIPSSGSDHPR